MKEIDVTLIVWMVGSLDVERMLLWKDSVMKKDVAEDVELQKYTNPMKTIV